MPKVRKEVKPFINQFAKEARAGSTERGYWASAAHYAREALRLSKIAAAYHLGEDADKVLPSPVGASLLRIATELAHAEQCALAIRKHRSEERERAKGKSKG